MSIDEKGDSNTPPSLPPLKRPKLDSTSSDPGLTAEGEVENKVKRVKLEQVNESSSPGTSESNLATE